MYRALCGDRVALGRLGRGLAPLPCLLLVAGYTVNAEAGPFDDPPPASLPPTGRYDVDPVRTRIVDGLEALPIPRLLKVLLRDGISYHFDRYHSLELDLFGRSGDGPGEMGQVFLQWRIALD